MSSGSVISEPLPASVLMKPAMSPVIGTAASNKRERLMRSFRRLGGRVGFGTVASLPRFSNRELRQHSASGAELSCGKSSSGGGCACSSRLSNGPLFVWR